MGEGVSRTADAIEDEWYLPPRVEDKAPTEQTPALLFALVMLIANGLEKPPDGTP